MRGLEDVSPPKIGGTLPHDTYARALYSIAVSLKRIADEMARQEVTGSLVEWDLGDLISLSPTTKDDAS